MHPCDHRACCLPVEPQAQRQPGPQGRSHPDVPEPPERELAVLEELSREDGAWVAFQGLKRELDLHQQQLSRTLTRLERDGLVTSGEAGYHLTEDGFATVAHYGDPERPCGELPVAQVLLPPTTEPEAVEQALAGRWFDGMHWYGRSDGPGESVLVWRTEPGGSRLRLRVSASTLTVTVDRCQEPAPEVYPAVHTLLAAATEPFSQRRPAA